MATLNLPQNGKAKYGRTRKSVPAVDLTAMVDLAFLLITFFMLTTSLSKFMIVIIKPTAKSSYKNLVDALDAMKISGVASYAIDDEHFFKTGTDYMKRSALL
nr:biopolymer transporter ExbD [Pedobacter sp. ASV19]